MGVDTGRSIYNSQYHSDGGTGRVQVQLILYSVQSTSMFNSVVLLICMEWMNIISDSGECCWRKTLLNCGELKNKQLVKNLLANGHNSY